MNYDAVTEFERIRSEVGSLEAALPERTIRVRLARSNDPHDSSESAILYRVSLRTGAQSPELWVVLADGRTGLAFEHRWRRAHMAMAGAGELRKGKWPPVEFLDAR